VAHIRHLRNAPITEALIDLRVILPKGFEPSRLFEVKGRLMADYPGVDERKGTEGFVKFAAGQPISAQMRDLGLQGIWLKSSDGKNIGQFRVDGFTFNRLKPYTSWDEILPEALRLWQEYVRVVSPETVTRIALRYINHLTLPPIGADLDDLLTTGPRVPEGIPQTLSSFFTRIVVQDTSKGVSANVAQALEAGVQTNAPTLLLDIDAYRIGQFPPEREVLARHLSDLRSFKNAIFFGSLTDQLIGPYE